MNYLQGRIQDFKLGGGALKKIAPSIFFPIAEGGAKIVGVFRVKNHDFTPKNHIFSNFREGVRRVRPPLDPSLTCPSSCVIFHVITVTLLSNHTSSYYISWDLSKFYHNTSYFINVRENLRGNQGIDNPETLAKYMHTTYFISFAN